MRICAVGLRGIPGVMGGIETHCEQLYPRLIAGERALEIVVIGRSGHARAGVFDGVRVKTLWAPKQKTLETLIHTPLAIAYARFAIRPDVLHIHAVGPAFFTPLAKLLGMRVVATHHAADYDRPKWGGAGRRFLLAGEAMMARFADQIICVNRALGEAMSVRRPNRRDSVHAIHNGAPLPAAGDAQDMQIMRRLGVTAKRFILAVGRLEPTKGFHDLVEAFKRAAPHGMKLVIAGAPTAEDAYSRGLMANASDSILFPGRLSASELRTLYSETALFVHPSYLEGFAIVVLEALAARAPVLLSDIPAHGEVGLEPGLYYRTGDVSALAQALSDTAYDRFRTARLDAILQDASWDHAAARTLEVFRRALRD